MKALLIAENWPPRIGGIENYLTHIARLLPKQSVTVIAPQQDVRNQEVGGRGDGVKEVIRKRFFWPIIKPAWLPLWLYVKKLAQQEKFDVTICGKALLEGQIGYRLKKKFGIPYIVCTYAMEIEVWAKQGGRVTRSLKAVLQYADRVSYINDETKQALLKLGVTESQLVKIWPGVDDAYFEAVSDDDMKRVLNAHHIKPPYIFAMGRLTPRKGFDVLIEGFAGLDQMKLGTMQLVIGGDGPEADHLRRVVEKNFIGTSVKLLGRVPDNDLPALYKGARVFALTPRKDPVDIEGFGIVYMEAAACGVPALGTNVGGVSEAIVDGQTGIVVAPDDPGAITKGLEKLLLDESLRHTLAEQAKQRAWSDFRWSKRILLVKGMIDAMLAEKILGNIKP